MCQGFLGGGFNLCNFKMNGNTSIVFSFKQVTASNPSCARIASIPDPSYFSCWARKLLLMQLIQFTNLFKLFEVILGLHAVRIFCCFRTDTQHFEIKLYSWCSRGFYINLKSELGESPQVPWNPKCISHLRTAATHPSHCLRPSSLLPAGF